MTIEEAVTQINDRRRQAAGSWFNWSGEVDGMKVTMKIYGTWIQIFRCPSFRSSSPHGLNVGAFKSWLQKTLKAI